MIPKRKRKNHYSRDFVFHGFNAATQSHVFEKILKNDDRVEIKNEMNYKSQMNVYTSHGEVDRLIMLVRFYQKNKSGTWRRKYLYLVDEKGVRRKKRKKKAKTKTRTKNHIANQSRRKMKGLKSSMRLTDIEIEIFTYNE